MPSNGENVEFQLSRISWDPKRRMSKIEELNDAKISYNNTRIALSR